MKHKLTMNIQDDAVTDCGHTVGALTPVRLAVIVDCGKEQIPGHRCNLDRFSVPFQCRSGVARSYYAVEIHVCIDIVGPGR